MLNRPRRRCLPLCESLENRRLLTADYTLVDLGVPAGMASSSATCISSNGLIAGTAISTVGVDHVFLFDDGKREDLGAFDTEDFPDGEFINVTGVNSSGEVIGFSRAPMLTMTTSFAYSNGTYINVPGLDGNGTNAAGVNDVGTIVGTGYPATNAGLLQGFADSGSTEIDIGTFGGASSAANAINASGVIAGSAYFGINEESDTTYDAVTYDGNCTILDFYPAIPTARQMQSATMAWSLVIRTVPVLNTLFSTRMEQ